MKWLIARQEALLDPSAIPCSLYSLTSCVYSCLFSDSRRTISSKFFDTQVPSVSTEKFVLPLHARCALSRLRCNRQNLLLSSCFTRIVRIKNPSYSICGRPSQNTSLLILLSPATFSLRRLLFGNSAFPYDLWSRPLVSRLLLLYGLPPCPHFS